MKRHDVPSEPPSFLRRLWDKLLGRSDIVFHGSTYMERWRLIDCRWFGIRVHHILRSDSDQEMHDHPFDFTSLILLGGYTEHTPLGVRHFKPGRIVRHKAEDLHRLELRGHHRRANGRWELVSEIPAWTLVWQGPRRRRWGFKAPDGEWIDAADFERHQEAMANRAYVSAKVEASLSLESDMMGYPPSKWRRWD